MRFTIDEAARATGGSFSIDPVNDQAEITSLTWDSRNVEPGALYVALPGERVDGHAFAASSVAAGAVCVLAQHALDQASDDEIAAAGAAVIQVPDTQAAVTALARAWRDRLEGRVIGITGNAESWLAKESDALLLAHVDEEGGPLNRAPRNSVLAEMFVLQALSAILQADVAQTPAQYVRRHPGGALGKIRDNER